MNIKDIKKIKTQEEARQFAIDWQHWMSTQSLSYRELADWQTALNEVAFFYNLFNEFRENGII